MEKTSSSAVFWCPKCGTISQDDVLFLCNKCNQDDVVLKGDIYICPKCLVPGENFECMRCGSKEVKLKTKVKAKV